MKRISHLLEGAGTLDTSLGTLIDGAGGPDGTITCDGTTEITDGGSLTKERLTADTSAVTPGEPLR